MRSSYKKLACAVVLLLCPVLAKAQADETWRSWNRPVKPFRIIGNIYYVGASDVTSFLITTPEGHILLDSGFEETVPQIQSNVATLGFKLGDIKIIVNSHAHTDHAGGLSRLKELTGAKLAASEADAALLARGGRDDFAWGDSLTYKPVTADRLLRDKDKVELGGVTMIARLTPGHTKGCTTWTMKVKEEGREYDVVFIGSTTAPGYKLADNPKYPNIASDYEHTFQLLKSLPCDVFLAPHGSFFAMETKMRRMERGEKPNPFIDSRGYRGFIERTEEEFREKLRKERESKSSAVPATGPSPPPSPLPRSQDDAKRSLPKIIRRSGGVLQASAIRQVSPLYPPQAREERVAGSVVVEVTIDEDGKVISTKVISGHPLLNDAAVDAARDWRWNPTQLSGQPVKVIGIITFNFTL